jgi:hypothetical protein
VRGLEPSLRILLDAVADDALEARRDLLVRDGEVRRLLLEDRGHRLARGVGLERAPSREHLVEDRAEGEDVGARVGGLALDLLRRHVAQRAHDDAGLGAGARRREIGLRPRAALGLRQLGEAEVEDLDPPVLRHEDVLGLQIPVDDALVVRGRQAMRDLDRVVDRLPRREASRRKLRAQRLALEQLLDDVGRPVMRPDVVDDRDVGWLSSPAAFASCSNRRRRSASDENDAGSTLIATSRERRGSFAR